MNAYLFVWVKAGLWMHDIWYCDDIIPINKLVSKVGDYTSRPFEHDTKRTVQHVLVL